MPFEFTNTGRVAIIGGGISGLAAAYELSRTNNVTVYEAAPRLGGHARTVMAGRNSDVPVDTGFIVFNYANYPNLTRMFEELDVPVKKSCMSFAASIEDGTFEYGLKNFASLTAQTRNMVRPQFWRMIADLLKFNDRAFDMAKDPDLTVGELLDRMKLGDWFRRYYLLPVSGAIWSSTPDQMADFPARSLLQFFKNHALLSSNTHQWYTVDGGSVEYVTRIASAIQARGGTILTGQPVRRVERMDKGGFVQTDAGSEFYDQIIFACHSDQALSLLAEPTRAESAILGNMRYQDNEAVLHSDISMMPKRRKCWASWVYQASHHDEAPRIGITYWMNSLQGIDPSEPMFVSLNPAREIREDLIYDTTTFRHPVFDRAAINAQADLGTIQGLNRTWYCGAYTRFGFHEDGYASAVAVTDAMLATEIA